MKPCPKTGSLRTWLWVCFLRDIHPVIWAKSVSEAGRGDDETLTKLVGWWKKWTELYPMWQPSLRAGRQYRLKQARRKRRSVNSGMPSLATGWR